MGSEVLVQVGFVGALLEELHGVGHLPQEHVDAQLDAGQIGDDDLLTLGCHERHAQCVGRLGLLRVDARQVLHVVLLTGPAASGVSARVLEWHGYLAIARIGSSQERLQTCLQQRGLDFQAGLSRSGNQRVGVLLQLDERVVRLGERRCHLVGVGRRLLHRRVDTQLVEQCSELGGGGKLRANLFFDGDAVLERVGCVFVDAQCVCKLQQRGALFFLHVVERLVDHAVVQHKLGLDQHARRHVDQVQLLLRERGVELLEDGVAQVCVDLVVLGHVGQLVFAEVAQVLALGVGRLEVQLGTHAQLRGQLLERYACQEFTPHSVASLAVP